MKAFLILLLMCVTAAAQDLYVNFEDVAAGTTDSAINMGTISKTNGNAVTFSWTGAAGKVSVENGGMNMGLLRPVTVAGTSYTNNNPTKHLLCKSDNTVSTHQKFIWTFAASRKISIGFSITLSNFSGLGAFYNSCGLESGGTYTVHSIINTSPITMQCETNSDVGAKINVLNNLPIWVTALWDSANGKTIWDFYNMTNMTLIGRSTGATVVNATITSLNWGITDAHTKDAGTVYRMNNMILYTNGTQWPVWPGGGLQIPTNMTPTGVQAAHDAASSGQYVILPATNRTWTSGVTISKNNLIVAGLSSQSGQRTNTTVIVSDGVFNTFTVSGDYNTFSNFTIRGDLTTDEATGFINSGSWNRYTDLFLHELDIGMYAQDSGLMDNCVNVDHNFMSRNIWGNGAYDSFYPLPWDSTNTFVYEDCRFYWTSGKNTTGSGRMMSSQQGDSWVVRHCYFDLNNSSTDPAPMFDFHGNDPGLGRPGVSLQIYSNYFNFQAGSVNSQKFVDVRGTRSLIYSNKFVGGTYPSDGNAGIHYREEDVGLSPNYIVNNSYNWENYHGASGTTPMPVVAGTDVTAGVDFFNTALSPLTPIPYPHPVRGASAQITPVVPASIGIGRGTVRIGASGGNP